MASSQQQKGRGGALTALDLLIQTLNIAKDACGIPPAQVALGFASVLLTIIRVRFSLFRQTSGSRRLGHDGQRSGIRRAWARLR
jgi:hypothetical protein